MVGSSISITNRISISLCCIFRGSFSLLLINVSQQLYIDPGCKLPLHTKRSLPRNQLSSVPHSPQSHPVSGQLMLFATGLYIRIRPELCLSRERGTFCVRVPGASQTIRTKISRQEGAKRAITRLIERLVASRTFDLSGFPVVPSQQRALMSVLKSDSQWNIGSFHPSFP